MPTFEVVLHDLVVPNYGFFWLHDSRASGLEVRELMALVEHLDKIGVEYSVWTESFWQDGRDEEFLWADYVEEYNLQSDWFGCEATWVLDEGVEAITFLARRGLL